MPGVSSPDQPVCGADQAGRAEQRGHLPVCQVDRAAAALVGLVGELGGRPGLGQLLPLDLGGLGGDVEQLGGAGQELGGGLELVAHVGGQLEPGGEQSAYWNAGHRWLPSPFRGGCAPRVSSYPYVACAATGYAREHGYSTDARSPGPRAAGNTAAA